MPERRDISPEPTVTPEMVEAALLEFGRYVEGRTLTDRMAAALVAVVPAIQAEALTGEVVLDRGVAEDDDLLVACDSLLSLCRYRERLTAQTKTDIDQLLRTLRPRTDRAALRGERS